MIIRSADKESIVNFDNLSLVQVEEKKEQVDASGAMETVAYRVMAYDTGSQIVVPIGEYATREKAIEVIDGIECVFKTQYDTGTYQMPPDEEPQEGTI